MKIGQYLLKLWAIKYQVVFMKHGVLTYICQVLIEWVTSEA